RRAVALENFSVRPAYIPARRAISDDARVVSSQTAQGGRIPETVLAVGNTGGARNRAGRKRVGYYSVVEPDEPAAGAARPHIHHTARAGHAAAAVLGGSGRRGGLESE